MRNTGNLKGISLELFIVIAYQAVLLLIILVVPASAQTKQKRPTATRPPRQVVAEPAPKVSGCLSRPADAVMTVQKNADGYFSGHVDSVRAYTTGTNDCFYFVVDVILPHGFNVTGHTENAVNISGEFSDMSVYQKNNCTRASFRTIVYWKPLGRGFTKVYDFNHQGVWVDGGAGGFTYCDFFSGQQPLRVDIPQGGVTVASTYRVLVLPKLNGLVRGARVKWWASQIPD